MKYISSDTNVWIDFLTINRLELPFKLPYIYLMNEDAVEDEMLSPPNLGDKLVELGLEKTSLTEDEFFLAEKLSEKYLKLSRYDCIALAIAKIRKIELLTGDKALRKAANSENVKVTGTIGILDRLLKGQYIDQDEYICCLDSLSEHNGKIVRLPEKELKKRLKK